MPTSHFSGTTSRMDDALAHEVDGTTGAGRSGRASSDAARKPPGTTSRRWNCARTGLRTAVCRGEDRSGRGAAQRGSAGPGLRRSIPPGEPSRWPRRRPIRPRTGSRPVQAIAGRGGFASVQDI
jgi:hypothetical protein